MKTIKYITIHCADTPNGRHHTAKDIDSWHKERKFNRIVTNYQKHNPTLKHIGYHYVIRVDGVVESGRAENETGAHVQGHNLGNIGICLIGKDKYTPLQWNALQELIKELLNKYGQLEIKGHRDWAGVGKTCPGFDVKTYVDNKYSPSEGNIYVV